MIKQHSRFFVLVLGLILTIYGFLFSVGVAYAQIASLPAGTRIDYTVGLSPVSIAFDNVTNSVWVVNRGSATISKVSIIDGTKIDYAVGQYPTDVTFDNVTN